MKHYGATYFTDGENFGLVNHVFEVSDMWEGYRYHGYMSVPALICCLLSNGSINEEEAIAFLNNEEVTF